MREEGIDSHRYHWLEEGHGSLEDPQQRNKRPGQEEGNCSPGIGLAQEEHHTAPEAVAGRTVPGEVGHRTVLGGAALHIGPGVLSILPGEQVHHRALGAAGQQDRRIVVPEDQGKDMIAGDGHMAQKRYTEG